MLNYFKGAFFLIAASFVSVLNDILMKYVSASSYDILFLRFFFATIFLIPFMLFYKIQISQNQIKTHATRALIFGVGMFFFLTSLKNLSIAVVTCVNFSTPFWVLLLAKLFLKEKLNNRILPVFIALTGIVLICVPIWENSSYLYSFSLIIGSIIFAGLDVFNKYLMNENESMILMLFGSSLGITLLYLPFFSWSIYSIKEIMIFVWLGIGANLILYFILKAWQQTDISALQPIKYIEFPISATAGFFIFKDQTSWFLIYGFALLLIAMLINLYYEIQNKKNIEEKKIKN